MGFRPKEEIIAHTGGKVLIYGKTGTGKSTVLGTFPNINLVDSEDGNTFYLKNNPNIKGVLRTTSVSEVQDALDELDDEELLNEFDTIGVDSGTKLYENMQAAAYEITESRARKQINKGKSVDMDDLNLSQRDWGHIKRWNQRLKTTYISFSSMGKWVVETAHEKDVFRDATFDEKKKGIDRVKIGEAPDLAKKAEYDFDIILQTFTKEDKEGVRFYAKVIKDRTQVTKKGQILENPSFETWREKWESTKKYGVKSALNLSQGVKKDKSKMEIENNNAEDIVSEIKTILKSISETNQKKIGKFMKDKNVNLKDLVNNETDLLQEILDFAKLLIKEK
ncbi:MAG TPA: AAA family ATPase [Tissierellia bacterium]|nr:AAA family ATPase [Tissierellia bacterium]